RLLDNDNDHEIVKRVGSQMVALPDFLKAMNALYAEFVDVLVENDFLRKGDKAEAKVQKPMMQAGDIRTGDIRNVAIANIGGYQYFAGDVVIHLQQVQERVMSCPLPPAIPEQ